MQKLLGSGEYTNWQAPRVLAQAEKLSVGLSSVDEMVHACFLFVRDEIKHSGDHKLGPVTIKASDVLTYRTGYCFAKSHLLVALLRANGVAAGLCYQRLVDSGKTGYCLHGLVAVFLKKYGWFRLDARGNNETVATEFCPPIERLAFSTSSHGEATLPQIWAEPLPTVIDVLERSQCIQEVADSLPDLNHRVGQNCIDEC